MRFFAIFIRIRVRCQVMYSKCRSKLNENFNNGTNAINGFVDVGYSWIIRLKLRNLVYNMELFVLI